MQLVKAGRLGIVVDVADCRLCREPHVAVSRTCVTVSTAETQAGKLSLQLAF